MEYVNLHVSAIDSAEFKASTPGQQGTWLCCLRFACGQEDGETIRGCRQWSDRQWQTVVGAEKAIVVESCGLWEWKGDDLVLNFYPIDQERKTRSMRRGGIRGNRIRWGKTRRGDSPRDDTPDSPPDTPGESPGKSITERNGMECNETKGCARVVTLEMALQFIRSNGDVEYTDDEVKVEWLYFDARRGPNGEWLTERGQVISDWRSALTRALMTRRLMGGVKNGAEKSPSVWEKQQRIAALRALEGNHPANENSSAWSGEPTAEECTDLVNIRANIAAIEREIGSGK